MKEPLLRKQKAAAAAALAGKQDGRDPDAAPSFSGARKEDDDGQKNPKKTSNAKDNANPLGKTEDKAQERTAALAGKQDGGDPDAVSPSDAKEELKDIQLAGFSTDKNPRQPNADEVPVQIQSSPDPPALTCQEAPTLESLREQARRFAKSAAGSSIAATADAFCRAAEQFDAGKDRKKRAMDTELSKAAMAMFLVARGAPCSEAALATVVEKLTSDAQMILLSETDSKPRLFDGWWRRASSTSGPQDVTRPSFKQRLRAAISAPEPMLPIHAEREKQLVDKREVLYSLALGAPVAILTSAAGLNLFPGAWAWVAGASVGVWILAAGGMVVNRYAELDWERLAARHLGRLGALGAAVLLCCFTYRAFFPGASWGFWILIAIAAFAFGYPWASSCIRGDDVVT